MAVSIRRLNAMDEAEWLRLRLALWPDSDPEELREEMPAYVEGGDRRIYALVADRGGDRLGALMELSLRGQAEGCFSSPVGYIEALYVDEDLRREGLATRMFEQACKWFRQMGCAEVASDCVLENEAGVSFHEALGFEEVGRLVHFVYTLEAEG